MDEMTAEQVYLDAVAERDRITREASEKWQHRPLGDSPFRAAVDSAYRAARLATAREIADAANRPGSVPADSWRAAMDIIDDLERAARAAGKDKTDG